MVESEGEVVESEGEGEVEEMNQIQRRNSVDTEEISLIGQDGGREWFCNRGRVRKVKE